MNNATQYANNSLRDDGEIKGLFCEEMLREWLHNLEQLIIQRDLAHEEAAARESVWQANARRQSHLTLVKN